MEYNFIRKIKNFANKNFKIITELIDELYKREDIDESSLFNIEIKYLSLFKHLQNGLPQTIKNNFAKDPSLFVEVIKNCFFEEDMSKEDIETQRNKQLTEEEKNIKYISNQLYLALEKTFIFSDAENTVKWLQSAKKFLLENKRVDVGEKLIGKILSNAPIDPEDRLWPVKYVREIVENTNSENIKDSFITGKVYSLGVRCINQADPGGDLRELAKKHKTDAESLRFEYPSTASLLEKIAEQYERWARRDDNREVISD